MPHCSECHRMIGQGDSYFDIETGNELSVCCDALLLEYLEDEDDR